MRYLVTLFFMLFLSSVNFGQCEYFSVSSDCEQICFSINPNPEPCLLFSIFDQDGFVINHATTVQGDCCVPRDPNVEYFLTIFSRPCDPLDHGASFCTTYHIPACTYPCDVLPSDLDNLNITYECNENGEVCPLIDGFPPEDFGLDIAPRCFTATWIGGGVVDGVGINVIGEECWVSIPGIFPYDDCREGGIIDDDLDIRPNIDLSQDFNIVPNPANDILTIEFSDDYNGIYEIFDLSGRLMKKGNLNSSANSIQVQEFNEGVYILKMTSSFDNRVTMERFIKSNNVRY